MCSARTRRTTVSSSAPTGRTRWPCGPWPRAEPRARAAEPRLGYRLEVDYPDGKSFSLDDPYRFLPSLGELDLYLAGEGRHEELYGRLGAHVEELEDVQGVALAGCAPA